MAYRQYNNTQLRDQLQSLGFKPSKRKTRNFRTIGEALSAQQIQRITAEQEKRLCPR